MKSITKYAYIALSIIVLNNAPFFSKCITACYADNQVSAAEDITIAVPWVKSGKVLVQKGDFLYGPLSVLLYKDKDGKYLCLTGRIDTMNSVLANEVKKEDARQFLEKQMTEFIYDALSYPVASNTIITEGYVNLHEKDKEVLKPYAISEIHPFATNTKNMKVTGNTWTININVATRLGAIEAWVVSGTVDPLTITAFSKTILKPNGTLHPDTFFIH